MTKNTLGLTLLSGFFFFGTAACFLTSVMLLFPGSALDVLWRLNAEAQSGFRSIDRWALPLMVAVGVACALSAIGLVMRRQWGRYLAIGDLAVNLIGVSGKAVFRSDYRALIGLPIGAALIAYLISPSVRRQFSTALKAR